MSNFASNLHIYIVDSENSIVQDLTSNNIFNFTIGSNELSNNTRLYINITANTMTTGINKVDNSVVYTKAYSCDKSIFVMYNNANGKTAVLNVYNMLGQKVAGKIIQNGTSKIDLNQPNGEYIVQVICDDKVYTNKVNVIN